MAFAGLALACLPGLALAGVACAGLALAGVTLAGLALAAELLMAEYTFWVFSGLGNHTVLSRLAFGVRILKLRVFTDAVKAIFEK